MTLKRQLLAASLMMLVIPWAGLQFVLDLDQALRAQATQQLSNQAQRMAGSIGNQLPPPGEGRALYAETPAQPIKVDGYGDDWSGYDDTDQPRSPAAPAQDRVRWQLAADDQRLYLLLKVTARTPIHYFDPGRPEQAYEQVRLFWLSDRQRQERDIRTPAPGPVVGWHPDRLPRPDHRVTGVWQATAGGYQLEVTLPRPASDRFSFSVWRPDPATGTPQAAGGPGSKPSLPRLVTRRPALEQTLATSLSPGQTVRLLDRQGWVLADRSQPAEDTRPDFDSLSPLQIIEQISLNGLRALVRHFQPVPRPFPGGRDRIDPDAVQAQGIVRHAGAAPTLMVSTNLPAGQTLILEQSLDQLLTLSSNALGSVIARSTLLIVALMIALLGYASWLSWRITRLQRSVRACFDDDGRVLGTLPATRARDELGELSRQFSQMTDRLQGYTRYLEGFARRLSHELKTPVAVVRSSLENLSEDHRPETQQVYLSRAHQATDRLSQILQGMSEAARLEQSFDQAEKERFDLARVAAEAAAAYQALSPGHRIRYEGPEAGAFLTGSPELMVQLLDKLVDNARDFTPTDGAIVIAVNARGDGTVLTVSNEGPALPAHLTREIFSPFVSLRSGTDQGHLGQGLLIVRLIADFHQGSVTAQNAPDGRGVIFRIGLPGH